MNYSIVKPTRYQAIQEKYNVNSLLAKTLENHKMSEEELKMFLNPKLIYHDFSLFEESDMVLERIQEAIENEEKICIYGDYDCDGILATTILVQAFLELGVEVGYHIPNRFNDGYGLNALRVEQMAQKGYSLIITVDNGVKAFEAVDKANELGVDVIITDHHQYDQTLPDACAFIHTGLSPDYPFKCISGGFVAYKLATALLENHDRYLFSLAAVTTVSDMMPLLDENRSLVKRALEFMNQEHYPSLDLLLGDVKTHTTSTIGFTIAPKINSFGRLPELCNPNHLVKYFLKGADEQLLMKISTMATEINKKRQDMTNEQYMLAQGNINDYFLYWGSADVHEGLVGLIAGKYTREYERPSFVMNYDKDNHIYKGSARSVEGFSLHDFFVKHQELLITSGGHALAGGFSLKEENYESFKECLEDTLKSIEFSQSKEALEIEEDDISLSNIASLEVMEPFGMGNEEPLYALRNLSIDKVLTLSEGKHLKMEATLKQSKITLLFFNEGHLADEIKEKGTIDVVGHLAINEFRNFKSINFMIKDILP